jgi:dihydrofolate synthase/folylpolyglutamate synthase
MAELCVPCFSRIIITAPGSFKKSSPLEIYNAFAEKAERTGAGAPEIILIPETARAIDRARELAIKDGLPVLGTGSFYLAGEIRGRKN